MEQRPQTLPARNLGALLDETFAIYGRHLWRFITLVAVVQVPVSIVSTGLYQVFEGGPVVFAAAVALEGFGTVFVYGAAVFSVGQHYITGEITLRECYGRAWWRVLSLLGVTIVVLLIISILVVPPTLTDQGAVVTLASILIAPAIAVLVYLTMPVQAVIVEGMNAPAALRRSFELIRGSWWRIFGITLVLGLVALGLAIVLSIPFALIAALGSGQASGLSFVSQFVGDAIVQSIVQPVVFIAGTLLYYDMRVRKEEYSLSTMSAEMGIAAA